MNTSNLLLIAILLFTAQSLTGQDKYYTRDGRISFFSSTPAEDIEAHSRDVSSIFDIKTGKAEFNVPMKSFSFEKALMQEHFNENFIESHKYPEAKFKGKFIGIENVDFNTPGKYEVTAEGDLTVHGVTKPIKTTGTFIIGEDGEIKAESVFEVKPADHDIEIPGSVRENIAKVIEVTIKIKYKPLKR